MQGTNLPDPLYLIPIMAGLTLLPFFAVMVTSYVKLVVVMSLLRNALGIQQIPPNMVINGLAIILSLYIMNPMITQMYDGLSKTDFSKKEIATFIQAAENLKAPLQGFLTRHSKERERTFFVDAARRMWPKEQASAVSTTDILILIPSFVVSELTEAFQIGFLLYLPFIAIDLIVSNILLAMGMMMVSPMTISLPFKLLLFVLLDGWARLIHGLVLTYG